MEAGYCCRDLPGVAVPVKQLAHPGQAVTDMAGAADQVGDPRRRPALIVLEAAPAGPSVQQRSHPLPLPLAQPLPRHRPRRTAPPLRPASTPPASAPPSAS